MPDGTLRITLPKWGARHEAHAFIQASHAWIARQRAFLRQRPAAPAPWGDGTRFLLDGHEAIVRIATNRSRLTISSGESVIVTLAANRGEIRATVEAWLQDRARRELPALLLALSDTHGISVPRVSVRNQRARWGACSTSGTITLNWRLIQAPPFVREYVLLHELMHRREMNHSRRFWRLVAACCPRHAEARQWLRREGKALWSD